MVIFCRIFSVHSLAILVEHSLEVYFGLFVPPGPLLDTLSVPEVCRTI